jgi:hypothetical protein
MSQKYPGGLITKTPVVPSGAYEYSSAPGIWTLDQQAYWQKLGNWPTQGNVPPPATNPPFQYVSMLLQGDGTNGAQNNTFLDSSSNTRTITRTGTPTQGSFSPYGDNWGNYFPVGSSRGSTALAPLVFSAITLSGTFTVEAWVFMEADNSEGNVIIASTYPGTNNQFAIQVSTLKLACFDGTANRLSTGSVTLGTWTHVAFVRSGSTISFYINGAASGTATTSASLSLTTVAALGGYGGGLQGYISNLRVTNTQVYTGSFTPSTTPLTSVSGTQVLTCQSNRFIDNGPSARSITVNGSPSIQRYSPFAPSSAYSTSVIGGSGLFNTGNYLSVSTLGSASSGVPYCIEMWVYVTSFRGGEMRLCGAGTNDPLLQFSGSSELQFFVANSLVTSYATAFKTNQWYHIAVTRSGANSATMYLNGVSVASSTSSATLNTNTFLVGAQPTSPTIGLIGYMTDFRAVLGSVVYSSAFTPPTAPLTNITNTSLLCNFTNAGIFDNAMINNLETVGGAQISTSVKKYGSGSMSFDGSGDYLYYPSTPVLAYGISNFTVELWMYSNAAPGSDAGVVDQRPASTNGSYFMLGVNSSNRLFIYVNTDYRIGPTAATAINTAAWYHVAYVRSATTGTLYINGTSVGTWTDTTTYIAGDGFIAHHAFSASDFNGYIDGLRITDGYAVYTANFTPPTAAFPNS